MGYCYGPVPSRRLGFSLGIDLVPFKLCTFNCIYCHVGKTTKKSLKRINYVNFKALEEELAKIIKAKPHIDYISLAGSGEPTLHKNLDKIVAIIKKVTNNSYPVCLITNGSLLYLKPVREELKDIDLIIPSLDAGFNATFKKINNPHKGITFTKLISGLIALKREFKGKIWLEIMLVRGVNDSFEELKKLREFISKINPDKIQINFPVRPAWSKGVESPDRQGIARIKKVLGNNIEIASSVIAKQQKAFSQDISKDIIDFLKRRPATLEDLEISLGLNKSLLIKYLTLMKNKKQIRVSLNQGKRYFIIAND